MDLSQSLVYAVLYTIQPIASSLAGWRHHASHVTHLMDRISCGCWHGLVAWITTWISGVHVRSTCRSVVDMTD